MIAKNLSDELKKSVIYQMFLRSFNAAGTLKSAEKMLEGIKELGVDIVYLCPICEADDDEKYEYWSDRQKASKLGNPKNPYRIKNYFKIDSEYGTDEDLKSFVKTAHSLGVKVMLDLVYFHCGPNADFIEENPEFVMRDEKGDIIYGEWHFPQLNFKSAQLREYLIENMLYFVKEFDVDGYRCDVGDKIPLDFWSDAIKKVKEIKPSLIMINEGDKPEFIEKDFDFNYNYGWAVGVRCAFLGKNPATIIEEKWNWYQSLIKNNHGLRSIETHDITNDDHENRIEKTLGHNAVEAMFVLNFMMDGLPLIYNGNEDCDIAQHSIYSNRFYGGYHIDRSGVPKEAADRRRRILKELSDIKKNVSEIYDGTVEFLKNSNQDRVVTVKRERDKKVYVIVNTSDDNQITEFTASEPKQIIIAKENTSYKFDNDTITVKLPPYGYIVLSE